MTYVEKGIEYRDAVISGEIPASIWVKRACERDRDDRERDWRYSFDEKKAMVLAGLAHAASGHSYAHRARRILEKVGLRGGEFIESEMQAAFDTDDNVDAACLEILKKCEGRHWGKGRG